MRRERRWQATSWDREAREVEDLLAGMMELIANEITPFVKKLYFALTLVKPQKQIFGKSWEFGPTSLTPLPVRWDSQKGKKMFISHFRLFRIAYSE